MMASFNKIFFFVLLLLVAAGCGRSSDEILTSTEQFAGQLASYTSGLISSDAEIVVRFVNPVDEAVRAANAPLFSLQPSVRGQQRWTDERTVVFKPADRLQSGARYQVRFGAGKILGGSEAAGVFGFEVGIIPQDLDVRLAALEPDPDSQTGAQLLSGRILTADAAGLAEISRVLRAELKGQRLEPQITRETDRSFSFVLAGIDRDAQPQDLELSWDARPLGARTRGSARLTVPSRDSFTLTDVRVIYEQQPFIEISFSDPLDASQNLTGLVQLEGLSEPGVIIRNNRLLVYPRAAQPGETRLTLSSGIRSAQGQRLGEELSRSLTLAHEPPQLRLLGSGVILPGSTGLLLPFEAVNLGAVDVQVIRIFENNIPQFLQNQGLGDPGWSLREVGRPVAGEVVPLHSLGTVSSEAGKRNSYALDLSRLIEPEPGALYKVTLGFRQHQSLYPCEGVTPPDPASNNWQFENEDEEARYWDQFENLWTFGPYDWRERDNPCHSSYYTSNQRVSRNVLASDIGLIAKRGETGRMHVSAASLSSARPLSGVALEVLDFQQQSLGSGSTDSDGFWVMDAPERDPFLLLARRGSERAYLRLTEGSALSLSEFDVSGASVSGGVKGFLYSERDVWRPGDSLFVNLIVQAGEAMLPAAHPANFELIDPAGRVTVRRTVHPVNRMYAFTARTEARAETGRWLLRARVGGNTFTRSINIETIQPNRLRILTEPDETRLSGRLATLSGSISAEWLHGAVAGELLTDVSLSLRTGQLRFSDFPQFTFNDPSRTIESQPAQVFRGRLNAEGQTRFSHQLQRPEGAPGLIEGTLATRVFEESGNFSTRSTGFSYLPYSSMAGIRLEGADERDTFQYNEPVRVQAVLLDAGGGRLAGQNLTATVYELDWRWWWQRRNENLSQFFGSRSRSPLLSTTVRTNARGEAEVILPAEMLDWGRYLVQLEAPGGHTAGKVFFVGWSGGESPGGAPVRLTVETDREQYEVGETITLRFPGAHQARALVSLETGSEVLRTFWTETAPGMNEIRIPAEAGMSPTVYASVHVIQPHAQQHNDLPIRMYGVVPLTVNDPQSRLRPVLGLPTEIRPESVAELRISEQSGRAMTYTLALVDEGLLDLTNFRTPDPHAHFYAREALGVRTWDLYNDVAGAYAGALSRILAIGGDLELEREEAGEVVRFRPMVRFMGPFTLGAGATAVHQVEIPNYVGSVRVMVVAAQDDAFGSTSAAVPVRQPVMVLGTLPRVLGPGERVELAATVFAMDDRIREVDLSMLANAMFEGQGSESRRLRFTGMGDQLERFELRTGPLTGTARITLQAQSGNEQGRDEIELSIRNPNPPVMQLFAQTLQPGESWDLSYEPAGAAGTAAGLLEISSVPPVDLARHIRFLNRYPHSSLEAQLARAFPHLYLNVFTGPDAGAAQQAESRRRVEEAIASLSRYQLPNGGLAQWPGQAVAQEWLSSFALHFLTEAERAGYFVPGSIKAPLRRFQQQAAGNSREVPDAPRNADLMQAYRLYTLALSGEAPLGSMNRLREVNALSAQARWRLAAAYQVAGMPEAASQLVRQAGTQISSYRETGGTNGSELRDRAMILESLVRLGLADQASRLMMEISAEINRDDWFPPQTVAFALIAAARFTEAYPVSEQTAVRFEGMSIGAGQISGTQPLWQVPFQITETGPHSLQVRNEGGGVVFARLLQEGIPAEDRSPAASSDLGLEVRYLFPNGDKADPARLRMGTDFIAEVRVNNPGSRGALRNLALTQIFPSGWEIISTRADDDIFTQAASRPDYQDVRDDRILTYFSLSAGESKVFRVRLTATYAGDFILPAVQVSGLNDASVFARTTAGRAEVHR